MFAPQEQYYLLKNVDPTGNDAVKQWLKDHASFLAVPALGLIRNDESYTNQEIVDLLIFFYSAAQDANVETMTPIVEEFESWSLAIKQNERNFQLERPSTQASNKLRVLRTLGSQATLQTGLGRILDRYRHNEQLSSRELWNQIRPLLGAILPPTPTPEGAQEYPVLPPPVPTHPNPPVSYRS